MIDYCKGARHFMARSLHGASNVTASCGRARRLMAESGRSA